MKSNDYTQNDVSFNEKSPSINEEECNVNNNSLTSFLHRLRQMPMQKQQQLVSTSVAIVRNTSTPKTNGNCTSNLECSSQKETEPLTHDKVMEVVYGVRDNGIKENNTVRDNGIKENNTVRDNGIRENTVKDNERSVKCEKLGMCFVVDAHERRVRIVSKEEMRKQHSRLILLEDLPEDELYRFGTIFDQDDLENTDRYVHCDSCDQYYDFCCLDHPLYQCQDRDPAVSAQNSPSKEGDDRASLTLPGFLFIQNSSIPNAGKGPYEGVLQQDPKKANQEGYSWELRVGNGKPSYYIDAKDPRYSNWMRYINSPRHESEQNLIAFQYRGSVFYRVYRPVDKNGELLVWYASRVKKIFFNLKIFFFSFDFLII
ncbi:SET domain-containing protein [Meloidogyne graminicola]|uniref:SET domain-containing protein n=1 Tax=Meloidogyne graminicola TaxID=189291 RepID=A0A8S9ZP81_9BILA|nr:SET domain-containing protein [Meloidogyne graminicola]